MSDEKRERSKEYGKARTAFDDLSMDERASFLVDSVVSMLAEGVGQAGKVVSDVLEELGQKLDDCCKEESAGEEPVVDEPKAQESAAKTSSRRKKTSGSGKGSGGAKK